MKNVYSSSTREIFNNRVYSNITGKIKFLVILYIFNDVIENVTGNEESKDFEFLMMKRFF